MSLKQCFNVLHKYPIIFFAPKSLNVSWYEAHCASLGSFTIERFDDDYFSGIPGYNRLMLSKEFYRRFDRFEYILIYQVDAFVFRDELEYWCKQGYHYIGAPYAFVDMDAYPMKVLTKFRKALKVMQKIIPSFYRFKQVGNGGLSLRHIKKTLWLLNFKKLQPKLWEIVMEDNFFQYWGNIMFLFFKLPDEKTAAHFSIELEPERTYKWIDNKLPTFCHAFMRYEHAFWKPHIEKEGYKINE